MSEKFDVVIIGGGPAGQSAAIYLARGGAKVLVIGKDGGSLERAEEVANYYGVYPPVTGAELIEAGTKQAESFGAKVISAEVTSIEMSEHFEIITPNNNYTAKAVLLATGKRRYVPKIAGIKDFIGKGVSFCAVCDGFLYRGKRLALIGSGDYATHELEELSRFSKDIIVFTNDKPKSDKFPFEQAIISGKIAQVAGGTRAQEIVLTDGSTYAVDGIFVAEGTAGAADFARKLGVITEGENISVDAQFMTNIDGLYAAGDCVGGLLQVAKAVSEGAQAAMNILGFIKKQKKATN